MIKRLGRAARGRGGARGDQLPAKRAAGRRGRSAVRGARCAAGTGALTSPRRPSERGALGAEAASRSLFFLPSEGPGLSGGDERLPSDLPSMPLPRSAPSTHFSGRSSPSAPDPFCPRSVAMSLQSPAGPLAESRSPAPKRWGLSSQEGRGGY